MPTMATTPPPTPAINPTLEDAAEVGGEGLGATPPPTPAINPTLEDAEVGGEGLGAQPHVIVPQGGEEHRSTAVLIRVADALDVAMDSLAGHIKLETSSSMARNHSTSRSRRADADELRE